MSERMSNRIFCRRELLSASAAMVVAHWFPSSLFAKRPPSVSDLHVAPVHRYLESRGDTWITAWADDGNLYSVSDDTRGFNLAGPGRNLMVHQLSGEDPDQLTGVTVNMMDEYGANTAPMSALGYGAAAANDPRAWKANGITCIEGVLYVFVSKHDYPWRNKSLTDHRQTAADASIINSLDHGRTWTRTAKANYFEPMFPGRRFGAPFFITYGKDGAGGADGSHRYVYAISNNGFWNNGDNLHLGRVRRDRLSRLQGSDWEFLGGEDGSSDAAWTEDLQQARSILTDPGKIGMSAVQYLKPLGVYLLCQWHYPPDTFGGNSFWSFRVATKPWEVWCPLPELSFADGDYNPAVMTKYSSRDGRRIVVSTAGDFRKPSTLYKLSTATIDLQL